MRKLIKDADPDVVEEWKWMGTPVWSHDGIICTGESYKKVVKLTFAKGASLKDPARLFNSSLEGNMRRAIDIHEGEEIDETAFKALVREAVALNSAARRSPRRKRSPEVSIHVFTARDHRHHRTRARPARIRRRTGRGHGGVLWLTDNEAMFPRTKEAVALIKTYWKARSGDEDAYWAFLNGRDMCAECGGGYRIENLSVCPNCFNSVARGRRRAPAIAATRPSADTNPRAPKTFRSPKWTGPIAARNSLRPWRSARQRRGARGGHQWTRRSPVRTAAISPICKLAACPQCGASRGGGVHPMALAAWFLLIMTFPIYPIAASGAALAAVVFVGGGALLGVPQIALALILISVPVIAYFLAFKYERLAARLRVYRIARWLLRLSADAAAIAFVLITPPEQTGLSGGEIFGVILLVPIILWLVKLMDIALEAGGPRRPIQKGPVREFLDELKWNEAIIWGFPGGIIGFLIGNDTRILFGLFCLGLRDVLHPRREDPVSHAWRERSPRRFREPRPWRRSRSHLLGAGLGAAAGAVLGQMLDGRVQVEAVVIGVVLGVIVSLIMGAFSRRRAKE